MRSPETRSAWPIARKTLLTPDLPPDFFGADTQVGDGEMDGENGYSLHPLPPPPMPFSGDLAALPINNWSLFPHTCNWARCVTWFVIKCDGSNILDQLKAIDPKDGRDPAKINSTDDSTHSDQRHVSESSQEQKKHPANLEIREH